MKIYEVIFNGKTYKIIEDDDETEVYYFRNGMLYNEGIGFPSTEIETEHEYVKENWEKLVP